MSERLVYADNCHRQGVCEEQAHEITLLRAQLATVEREVFDYQQREKAWNESEALKDAVRWFEEVKKANYALAAAEAEIARLTTILNTPETREFVEAVSREAAHQRERWGEAHDVEKEPEEWFWTLGYLAGKALHSQRAADHEKFLHRLIASAALLANQHRLAALRAPDGEGTP